MSEPTTTAEEGEPGGSDWDAPNQQVVRPDMSGPWMEGDGGSGPPGSTDPQSASAPASDDPLDDMTKDELLEVATTRGIDVRDYWSKGEIREAIDNA